MLSVEVKLCENKLYEVIDAHQANNKQYAGNLRQFPNFLTLFLHQKIETALL